MKIEKKQITLLILTICALSFLTWQIFRLISDDLSAQDRATYAMAEARNTAIAQKKQLLSQPAQSQETKPVITQNSNPYVNLANQYQLLQMQHKLLNEQLAIAKLKAEIAKLNKEDNALSSVNHPPEYTKNKTPYQLVYLAQQNHHWSATILKNNQYQTINTGDTLTNGDKIVLVNQRGVILKTPKQRIQLTFNGADITALESHPHKTEQSLYSGHLPNGTKVTNDKPYTLDEVLLLELPANDYTIQLAKDNRLSDLKKLVHQFHLDPRAMLFHFQQNQETQHVLLLGSYKSKEEAAVALAKLPSELKLLTPQIISMDSVQQIIKAMR